MNLFDEINSWSADMVLSRINLPTARDGKSYICPDCGNGSGKSGDGIRPRTSNGKVRWKCFRCGRNFSNVDLIAASEGIDTTDTAEMARRISELYPEIRNDTFSFSRKEKSARRAMTKGGVVEMAEKKSASEEPKNYAEKFYPFCKKNYSLKEFVAAQGGKWRGLTLETLESVGALYNGAYPFDETKGAAVIFPYDDYHYFVRAVEGTAKRKSKGNGAAGLYIPRPLKESALVTFIVEGEIDALSIMQACKGIGSFNVVAAGSSDNWRKVVPELDKQFANASDKPKCIVLFDNDESGFGHGRELVQALRSAGYPAEFFSFEDRIKGKHEYRSSGGEIKTVTVPKVDANDILRRDDNGVKLFDRLVEACESKGNDLTKQAETLKKLAEQAIFDKTGIRFSSFSEYFVAHFFNDISMTAKYSERKTGFDNLDAAQVFLPGLYILGGLPATGKTTFAWQLLNQLAERGEFGIYCSYEMSRAELFAKSISRELFKRAPEFCAENKISSVNIRRGLCNGIEQLHNQAASFAKSAINLHVAELSNVGIAELIERIKPLISDADKSPVICLDYLQIIPSKNPKTPSTKEKIDDSVLRLKDFQRETNSTLIVISSFNRENYFNDVSFSSFKESGAIEYSADVIWGLQNNGVNAEGKSDKEEMIEMGKKAVREIKLSCLKNRNGGQYECFFRYHAAHDYFETLEKEKERRIHER